MNFKFSFYLFGVFFLGKNFFLFQIKKKKLLFTRKLELINFCMFRKQKREENHFAIKYIYI